MYYVLAGTILVFVQLQFLCFSFFLLVSLKKTSYVVTCSDLSELRGCFLRIHSWHVICFLCICRPYTLSVTQGSSDVRLLRWLHDRCLQWQLLGGKMLKILSHYPLLNPRSHFIYSECLFWKLLWWDDIYISAGTGEMSRRNPVKYNNWYKLWICFLCCSLSGW